jgi:signal transduction histidine kinase
MNEKTDKHVEDQNQAVGTDIPDGDTVVHPLLFELDAAQEKLNHLNCQLDGQYTNKNSRSCEMGCLKLSVVIESMAEGVVMINRDGDIEIANPVAKNLLALSAQTSLADVRAAMENLGLKHLFLSRHHSAQEPANEFMGKTPARRIIHMRWNAIRDKTNQFGGNVIVMRDATAQIELDKAQTEFIAAISHELRTPLTTIQNSISNILAGITGKVTPKTQQYLSTMEGDCRRLTRLVNDLLDMAKLEAGRMHISRSATNLVDLAAKAVRAFSGCAAEKGVTIELSAGGCISRAYVDSQRIYQVFSNLIINAIKYTEKGGKIWVSLFERDDDVVTLVEDTGIGISKDQHRNIFNKFYQIGRQAGPGYNGSGLGLALSNEIIACHGGKIWVESELGKGSKFYFSLPKTKPQIVLHQHLRSLVEWANKRGDRFAMVVVRLETNKYDHEQNKQAIGVAMHKIVLAGDEIATGTSDLIVRTQEREAVLVLSQTGKRYLIHVKRRLRNAVYDGLADYNFNHDSILPMIGIAIYPNDASTVEALEMTAFKELNRLL